MSSIDLEKPKEEGVISAVVVVSPEDDARIRRKVDLRLMPLLCAIYGLQYLDKTCMSYASVMGFRTDARVTIEQYAWLGGIFYVGYLVGEYPLSVCLQKLPLAKVTSVNIIIWGTILCLMSVGKDFTSLMVLRFFLGMFESSITPALALFTAQYYKASEQGTRTGIWFSFNSSGSIIGALMAFGLYQGDQAGRLSLAGWKLVFIILGVATIVVGILFGVLLPDTPDKARFFTAEEKELAIERIRANQQGVINRSFRPAQVKEALRDPLTWLYALVALTTSIPNGGVTNFFAILIQGFGFTTSQTLLLGMVAGWVAFAVIGCLWLGDKVKNRSLVTLLPSGVSTIGVVLVVALPTSVQMGRIVGFAFAPCFVVPFAAVLSLISSNTGGSTKKTTINAIFLIFYCVGNLVGPQTFRTVDAPRYNPAMITIIVSNVITMLAMTSIWWLCRRENARRDTRVTEQVMESQIGHEFDDLTDRQNPAFRYTL